MGENELLNILDNPPNMINEDFHNNDFYDEFEPPFEYDGVAGDNNCQN